MLPCLLIKRALLFIILFCLASWGRSGAQSRVNTNVEDLIDQLESEDEEERRLAAYNLGELGDTAAVMPLIDALEDPSCYVRGAASQALGLIGDTRAVDPLIERLTEIHVIVRGMAAYALGRIGDTAAVEPLIATLQIKTSWLAVWLTTNNYQREAAAWSLGEIGDNRAVQPLIDVLENPDPDIRMNAALSLGKLKDTRAAEPLIQLAQKDSRDSVRSMAAWSLVEIGTEDAEVFLATALEKKRWPVIAGGYKFYLRQGQPGCEDLLIKALKKFGTLKIACAYAYCGNSKLKEAGLQWAATHNVVIPAEPGDSPRWGSAAQGG